MLFKRLEIIKQTLLFIKCLNSQAEFPNQYQPI